MTTKPCPFCGSYPLIVDATTTRDREQQLMLRCPRCLYWLDHRVWASRTPPPATKMIVDDLRRAVRSGIGFPHHQIRFTEEEAAKLFEEWPEASGDRSAPNLGPSPLLPVLREVRRLRGDLVTAEHWTNEDGSEHALIPATADERQRAVALKGTPVKCCEAEAETWEQCVAWYEENVFPGEDEPDHPASDPSR